ncbi:MAG: hypothetical protein U1C04_18845 [Hydrogenophaga sp.]|uniref:hypothetical protein n=1 Tax=Hydrogenophaga sp. TaxID=1904254 RepID=UPI002ABCE100|nr:hypothetical protein [Hydrogenophaga sp.]MDZ4282809.1 hypothetical protein [Hydrogenophaga sp.]
MLNISRSGTTLAEMAASVQSIPTRVIPFAAATALTRTAKLAQTAVIAQMRSSFDRPTAYTLNSTFIVPATRERLTARVGVKNQGGSGIRPENYLVPGVFGGGRREKRFEAAFRLAGFMRDGERAMPGSGATLDANGNVSAGAIRTILRQVSKGASKRATVFAGAVGQGGTRGIWRREGGALKALFIFTTAQPDYSIRFDFEGAAAQASRQNFQSEFYRAASAITLRNAA